MARAWWQSPPSSASPVALVSLSQLGACGLCGRAHRLRAACAAGARGPPMMAPLSTAAREARGQQSLSSPAPLARFLRAPQLELRINAKLVHGMHETDDVVREHLEKNLI